MTNREAIDVLFNEWKCIDRNDGIHCDRKCESCDLVMDVGIIREAFNMAISALQEQEEKHSTELSLTQKGLDTISRQAAIDALMEIMDRPKHADFLYTDEICKTLNELPSAQQESKWIPVSERLPEYMESVLTWDGVTYCVEKRIRCIRDEEGDPIEGEWWVSDGYDDIESDYYPDLRDGAAIAWMPLPEPYRAERRTDEGD